MSPFIAATYLALCVGVALLAAYGFVPWLGRLWSLALLHGLRDRLYAIGDGEFRSTLVYQDIEFILCKAISLVHAGDAGPLKRMLDDFAASPGSADEDSWRIEAYNECATKFADQKDDAFGLLLPLVGTLLMYLVLARPATYLTLTLLAPPVILVTLGRSLVRGLAGPGRRLARAVEDGSMAPTPFGSSVAC